MVVDSNKLKPLSCISQELSQKYGVPFEIVESILIEWVKLLYENIRDVPPEDIELFTTEF